MGSPPASDWPGRGAGWGPVLRSWTVTIASIRVRCWTVFRLAILAPLLVLAASGDRVHAGTLAAISYGKGGCGRIVGAVPVRCDGPNFRVFSPLACVLARNHVHPRVARTLVDGFGRLHQSDPDRTWVFGDLGLPTGGRLRPHRTHQNGLSVDLFVPVVDASGEPAMLDHGPSTRFGYDLEFDSQGRLGELRIDFAALGRWILALDAAGRDHGARIERIILTPGFQGPLLRAVPAVGRFPFMKGEAWVRHDEHIHIDFNIPNEERRPLWCS